MTPVYLQQLTARLAGGLEPIAEDRRARHAAFLKAAQQPDGGFRGRQGDSDLYYTGFALRALAILGELQGELANRAAGFLRGRLTGEESIVDFFSLIYSAAVLDAAAGVNIFADAQPEWRDAVAAALERLRRPDGGYAKGAEGAASSTYHSFLVSLCQQLIERPTPRPGDLVGFILSQRGDDGGFREIRAGKRSGTNPTAAAIGVLRIFDRLDAEIREDVIEFLAEMQNDEGGLRANTRIPIADLLSTFTGFWTLTDLGAADAIDRRAALAFAESLEQREGGFLAASWDAACDVEYTFYGLGCLSLLTNEPQA